MTTRQHTDLIDLSHHQDYRIDFAAAKKAGVRGGYHKATEGSTYRDPDYADRRAAFAKTGLPFGGYHFARPSAGDADDEARHFLSVATPRPGDLLPALDLETTEGLSISALRGWAREWTRIVGKACGGHDPVVYSPFDLQVPGIRWRARYNKGNTVRGVLAPPALPWDVWQFSNGVLGDPNRVAGFPGPTDLNTFRDGLDLSALLYPKATADHRYVDLDLMHASMQFSDTPAQKESDADRLFARAEKRKAAWVTGTEAGAGAAPLARLLKQAASEHGYRFWMAPAQDSWIAVRKDLIAGGWETHYEKVLDGQKGRNTDKGVLSVTFDATGGIGRVTVIACHYLTKGRPSATDPAYRRFVEDNRRLATAIGQHAVERGKGSALVFYAGDQNIVDRVDDTFFGQPLTSAWDEMKVWENTGHGNIDVIASYDGDGRVAATYARALDDREFPLNTDHFLIEAGYRVRLLKAA
jgi:lysozyme